VNVRTVLGERDAGSLGFTHCHEHLFVFQTRYTRLPERVLLDDYDRTLREVEVYRARGGGALVDAQPFGAGRHADLLGRLARESGVAVIASTGLHKSAFYSRSFWSNGATAEQLAELFTGEIEQGMYSYDFEDPFRTRSGVKAGVIKIAAEEDGLTPFYRKLFDAAVSAHRSTGAPIVTHAETAEVGIEQAEYLLERGVRPEHVTVSHMDRRIDTGLNLSLASLGVFLEYDTIARLKYHDDAQEIALIRTMLEKGHAARITLGMDSTRERFLSYGGSFGLHYLLTSFIPALRKSGVVEADIERMTVSNPAAALAVADTRRGREN
jgi:predicted metal-dependent phosphotriesterase family hydrolase